MNRRRAPGLELTAFAVDGPEDFDTTFAAMSRQRPDAITGFDWPLNIGIRSRVIWFAEVGALPSDGVNLPLVKRGAALYVDKILRGAMPGDLPME